MPPGGKVAAQRAKPCCKDCKSTTRALSFPGPRCASCWRAETTRRKEVAHGLYVERTYDITAEEYKRLYKAQDGRCFICRRAFGITKRLAVDHDHKTGEVRGLLCSPCNNMLGLIGRDDPEVFERAAEYLRNPPARKVLTGSVAKEIETCQDQLVIASSQTSPPM